MAISTDTFPVERLFQNEKYLAILSIISLLFCLGILFIVPSAQGYELSIYDAYPLIFWILLILSIGFATLLIIRSYFSGSNYYFLGFFTINIIDIIILFLPKIRGYLFFSLTGSDIFYHLSKSNYVLQSGQISNDDIYPFIHILTAILNLFGLNPQFNQSFISVIFFILYISSLFLLGCVLFKLKGGILFSMLGTPLLYIYANYAFYPFFFAISLVPLVLYYFHKCITYDNKEQFYFLLFLLAISIVFSHPIITIFLIIIFVTFEINYIFFIQYYKEKQFNTTSNIVRNILAIISISFFAWYFNFTQITSNIQNIIFTQISSSEKQAIIKYQQQYLMESQVDLFLIVERYIKIYGSITIYLLAALVFTFILIYYFIKNNEKNVFKTNDFFMKLIYCEVFLVSLTTGFILFIGYFIIFEPIRIACFALVFSTILCGIMFYDAFRIHTSKTRNAILLIFILMMISTSALSIFNVYDSPWKGIAGFHRSNMEEKGFIWYLNYKDTDSPLIMDSELPVTYAPYIQSVYSLNPTQIVGKGEFIPSHFGYDQQRYLSNSILYPNFFMITTKNTKISVKAAPEYRRNRLKQFTDSDFTRLNLDKSVNKMYSNPEFDVWNVNQVLV
jgi:hypothetical protein